LQEDDGWLPTERELSAQLGVSRNVVREATKRLETQGLVEIQHGIGIKAVDRLHRPLNDSLSLLIPDLADRLRSLTEARLAIEPEAAALAAERATKKQLHHLKQIHARLEDAADNEEAVERDCAFHHAVADASGNLIFRLTLDSLAELGRSSRLRSMNRVGKQRAVEHHAAILKAIEDRNSDKARKLMKSHLLAAVEDLDLPSLKTKRSK
jgi:GntR family transcriptional repressor for pyruvate dehydrogenase complex